jgi:hypothetical protein
MVMTGREKPTAGQAGNKIEVTVFTKSGGPLTKTIALGPDGGIISDGSACLMSSGTAQRTKIDNVEQLAGLINSIDSNQALALGTLGTELPDQVKIISKDKLAKMNGTAAAGIVARTANNITYRPGRPAFALIDSDTKGIPPNIAAEIKQRGGFWLTLLSLFPALQDVACVTRRSTSAGLSRSDTGESLPGSDGLHSFLSVQDGADVERLLKVLHDRSWLAGFGWMMAGAGGQFLERSLIARSVFGAERLVFEGPPILEPPLRQDRESRRPIVIEGNILDSIISFPPLTLVQKAKLEQLKAKAKYEIAPEAEIARTTFIDAQAQLFIKFGMSQQAANRAAAKYCSGVLLPSVVLLFDDPALAGCNVGDVLADPDKFEGATLADPLEGIAYGTCKAKIFRGPDGTPWINSFAHGRTTYDLKYDAAAVRAAIHKAAPDEVVEVFIKFAAEAELDGDELKKLRDEAVLRSGVNTSTIKAQMKREEKERAEKTAEQQRQRQAARRTDPRLQIRCPTDDAPWLPVMRILNDVLGSSPDAKPPMRDIANFITQARKMVIPQSHAFVNKPLEEAEKLPVPEQWVLSRADEMELAEIIESHIDFVDGKNRSVHLPSPFVKHYLKRDDHALPTVLAIATAPIVTADGEILAAEGFDRESKIIFEIPKELRAVLPRREDCTDEAVEKAYCFLSDNWFCDVSTDFIGKAIAIAATLTNIERSLLPERPVYVVKAGRRGGGKTTLITMLLFATNGIRPAAPTWSDSEEERRKVLMAQLSLGVSYILWDNIKRNTQISCPNIERASTTPIYSDRKLGVTEMLFAPATAIQYFNGNNIGLQGDLSSRGLDILLGIDRADPENRPFEHPDPIGWTEKNRAEILKACYTILLGNPQLKQPHDAPGKTRFKMWWRLVGSAVEHAAKLYNSKDEVDFQKIFIEQEETQDEDSMSLADILESLHKNGRRRKDSQRPKWLLSLMHRTLN